MTIYPLPLRGAPTWPLADEPDDGLTAAFKLQILQAWQQFILSGFEEAWLTTPLFDFLFQSCGLTMHLSRQGFWEHYANSEINHLKRLINQFGGDRKHALNDNHDWLSGTSTADLKAALCDEMTPLASPLLQVLTDLEQQHDEVVQVWQDFAAPALPTLPLPPKYQVSANTRRLLAYAAAVARKRPLQGLQTMMFSPSR